jgi:hypothetical protein
MPSYSGSHLSIHPSINELLQARLPAQMLGISIVRCHVLPRIDLCSFVPFVVNRFRFRLGFCF